LRIAILGAGASGLCLGVKLREAGFSDDEIEKLVAEGAL